MALKRKKKCPVGTPAWMVSMGDMNNLLMCFFIIMMGDITTVTQEEFQMTISAIQGSLGAMPGGASLSKGRVMELGHNMMTLPSTDKGRSPGRMLRKAYEVFKPEIQSKYVKIREDERGLIITLMSDLFFEPGSARLMDGVRPVLTKVANLTAEFPNFVRIEGHTDKDKPVAARMRGGYETNWELSSARSVNVLRFIVEEENGNPKQFSAVAFGEHRPVDDNNTPEGRAANRRVEVVILKEKFLKEEKARGIDRPLPSEEWR